MPSAAAASTPPPPSRRRPSSSTPPGLSRPSDYPDHPHHPVHTATPPTRPCGLRSANRSSIPDQTANPRTVTGASLHHPRFLAQPPSRRSAPPPGHVFEPEDHAADRALETHLEGHLGDRSQHRAFLELMANSLLRLEIGAFEESLPRPRKFDSPTGQHARFSPLTSTCVTVVFSLLSYEHPLVAPQFMHL